MRHVIDRSSALDIKPTDFLRLLARNDVLRPAADLDQSLAALAPSKYTYEKFSFTYTPKWRARCHERARQLNLETSSYLTALVLRDRESGQKYFMIESGSESV